MKEERKRKLRVFEMTVLRKICEVTRKDRIRRNVDILNKLSIERDIISVICLQYGDLLTLNVTRIEGACRIGIWPHTCILRKRKTKEWIDNIRDDCMDIGISIHEASHKATDRERWRNAVCKMDCQSERISSSSSQL